MDAFERDRERMAVGPDSEVCLDCDEYPCICGDWTDEAIDWDNDPESEAT